MKRTEKPGAGQETSRPRKRHNYKGDVVTAVTRGSLVMIGILLQVAVMALLSLAVLQYAVILYIALEVVSVILAICIVYDSGSYRFFWLVIILLVPVVGLFLYLTWGSVSVHRKAQNKMFSFAELARRQLPKKEEDLDALDRSGQGQIPVARYLASENFPVYRNTAVRYYPLGDDMREDFFADLRNAEERIWLEYFIVFDGEIWDETESILSEKAKAGVDVRLLIDDFGSILTINRAFVKRMREKQIKLCIFSPLSRDLTRLALNYRNHQKVALIDRSIGYTGGINLADEYFNIYEKYGHWKDTAVRLEGEAVQTFSSIFTMMWNYAVRNESLQIPYSEVGKAPTPVPGDGWVQPFPSGPVKRNRTNAEMIYLSVISHARKRLWITTPYLVLDRTVADALIRAAESGIDVRIYTPRKYDKWYVYQVTESSYGSLLRAGVRIFEYLPGFIHAKNLFCDDECAICGSINLDYRSFYFHYEDAVLFYGGETVSKIRDDIAATEAVSEEIFFDTWKKRPWYRKLISWILKFCSPLF